MPEFLRSLLKRLKARRAPTSAHRAGPPWPGETPSILVRAGDIAREGGRRQEALGFYGRAIDAYLEAGLPRQAEALCRRVIELEPKVIRTRYTLTMIAIARGDVREARRRLADYMAAVTLAKAEGVAVPPLLEMAASTANPTLRAVIAEALRRAGRPDLGDGVEGGTAAPAGQPSGARALGAALKRPAEIDVDALSVS